jgi:hypothetical protein
VPQTKPKKRNRWPRRIVLFIVFVAAIGFYTNWIYGMATSSRTNFVNPAYQTREIMEEARRQYYERIRDQHLPEHFTVIEAKFMYYINHTIRWDSSVSRRDETRSIRTNDTYRVWTENIVEYLESLGYRVDTERSVVSW